MRDNAIVIPISALRRIFMMLVFLVVLILLVLVVRTQLFRAGVGTLFAPSAAEVIDRNAYQAVFLTNGSTFFGKLEPQGDQWFLLTDVFYLSVSDQSGTQLVKRGSESQGPKEPMIIPKDQILFIENLRDDGQVATAIRQFKSGQAPAATLTPVAPAPTTAAPTTARPSSSPSPTR
jgi:cell division septation protein DedD